MSTATLQATRNDSGGQQSQLDPILLGTVTALLMLGLVMVYSASIAIGDTSSVNTDMFWRQALHVVAGLMIAFVVMHIPVELWNKLSMPILLLAILALSAVLMVGAELNGSRRWIVLGGFSFQPAEYAKIAVIVYVASYLTRRQGELKKFSKGIVNIGLVLVVFAGLLLTQPDFGTFFVITCTVGLMMFLGGIRISHTLLCIGVAAIAMFLMIGTSEYRMDRLISFRNPWADPFDSGFQLIQALIAVGRGEIFGVGLGASIQKLYYLPHANNDFIFAVIGEELGLVGLVLVIMLFALFMHRALVISRAAELVGRVYAARLAQGVTFLIVFQALINMGVNLGALPTKGLTLPFISYGGSSMLVTCFALGLLFAVDRQTKQRAMVSALPKKASRRTRA